MEQNKGRRRWLVLGLLAVLLAGGLFYWNYRRTLALEQDIYQVQTLRQRDPLTLKGTAQVTESESVMADPTKGDVAEILVKSGQQVKAGDVLFTYQSQAAKEAAADARRQLERAEDTLRRAKDDLAEAKEDRSGDRSELETAEDRLESAKSRLRKAQKNLAEAQKDRDEDDIEKYDDAVYKENDRVQRYSQDVATYRARVDAWPSQIKALENAVTQAEAVLEDAAVLAERAQKGEAEEETAPIEGIALVHAENRSIPQASIVDILSPVTEIKGTVTEYDYFRLDLDQTVSVLVIPTDERISGKVSQISPVPQMSQASQMQAASSVVYEFSVLPQTPIQPGYTVEIEVALDEIIVPSGAVLTEGDKYYAWVYAGGAATKKEIRLEKTGTYWVLKEGLAEGDVLITDPDDKLTEGMAVKVEGL